MQVFDQGQDLKTHMDVYHGVERQFNCENFSYQGNSNLELKNHSYKCKFTSDEQREKNMCTCHTCGSDFDDKPSLMIHRMLKFVNIILKAHVCLRKVYAGTYIKPSVSVNQIQRFQRQKVARLVNKVFSLV